MPQTCFLFLKKLLLQICKVFQRKADRVAISNQVLPRSDIQIHETSPGKSCRRQRAECPQISHTANRTQYRDGSSLWPAVLTKPSWRGALHKELSLRTEQQLLRMAAHASSLDASQRAGRERLPGEAPFQRQHRHGGQQFKTRGELEQEVHHTE